MLHRSNLAEAKLGKHQRDVLKAKKHHHRQTAHISRGREMPSAFDSRSLAERQAALDLAHFAQPNPKSQLNANQLEVLIGALIVSNLSHLPYSCFLFPPHPITSLPIIGLFHLI